MSATQKVLYLTEKFGKLVVDTAPVPKPGPGELLVKVQSASLNPVDWKIQKYGLFLENFPAILGTDVAGDVVELGEGVTDFKKGDRVFTQGQFTNEAAGFQQYSVQLASSTAKIPEGFSYDDVATLPVALTCAYVGLYNRAPYGLGFAPPASAASQGIYGGTPLVVLGGSTSVGQLVIQFAKLSGFSPIITTASLKHSDFLKSIGATSVLDRSLPHETLVSSIIASAKDYTANPIKAVYDSVSMDDTQQLGADVLSAGGQLAVVLAPSAKLKKSEDKTVIGILGILTLPHNKPLLSELYHDLIGDFLTKKIIQPNRVEVLPNGLAGIEGGLQRMERDEISRGKLVARPQETP